MNQRREKEGVVIPTFDMHIYTTHHAKVGNGSEKRKRGSGYSPTLDMHIYTTHRLKWRMDQRREKGVVIIILAIYTFDMHIYTTHQLKLGMDQIRGKREWLF